MVAPDLGPISTTIIFDCGCHCLKLVINFLSIAALNLANGIT